MISESEENKTTSLVFYLFIHLSGDTGRSISLKQHFFSKEISNNFFVSPPQIKGKPVSISRTVPHVLSTSDVFISISRAKVTN